MSLWLIKNEKPPKTVGEESAKLVHECNGCHKVVTQAREVMSYTLLYGPCNGGLILEREELRYCGLCYKPSFGDVMVSLPSNGGTTVYREERALTSMTSYCRLVLIPKPCPTCKREC